MTQQWQGPGPSPARRRIYGPVDPTGPRHGHRIQVRRAVRHPLELLCLAVAIGCSVIAMGIVVVDVVGAFSGNGPPGNITVVLVLAPILVWFARGLFFAQQRLRGIRIGPTQYPEAHQMIVDAAEEYGLEELPDAYVIGGNGTINAFASGHGFRRFIVLYSDLFEVGGTARQPDTVRFIIGHELGHIAAGHTSYWRLLATFASNYVPLVGPILSRSQEYTSDNYGYRIAPAGAMGAIATLGAGKYLNATVDTDQLIDRVATERGFFVWWANAIASHPVLLWRGQALRDRSRRGRLLWRPRIETLPHRPAPSPYVGHLPPNPVLVGGSHPSQVHSTWAARSGLPPAASAPGQAPPLSPTQAPSPPRA